MNDAAYLTERDIRDILHAACVEAGGQVAWARQHGISVKWVNNVINGHVAPSAGVIHPLGYRRVMLFQKITG